MTIIYPLLFLYDEDHIDYVNCCFLTFKKVELATLIEGDLKAPFSIATTLRCRRGHYSIPRIAPLYS